MYKMYWLWKRFFGKKLNGSMMVEIILILVVLIALVGIFKTELTSLVGDIFDKITSKGLAI